MTSERNMREEAKEQIINSSRISGALHDTILRNKNMSVEAKVTIYKICVHPISTSATETRADTSITK